MRGLSLNIFHSGPVDGEPPQVGRLILPRSPGDDGAGMDEGPPTRRLAGATAGSVSIHLSLLVLLVLVNLRSEGPMPPVVEVPVAMSFVSPPPIAAPRAIAPAAPAPIAPPASPSPPAAPPRTAAAPPEREPPRSPFPEPNRMGERLPVPPPPNPSSGKPPEQDLPAVPPDRAPVAGSAETPRSGTPEGEGRAPVDAAPRAGGAGGVQGSAAGSLPVPAAPRGLPGGPQDGPGGSGPGRQPPRRGINYAVPRETGVYANFAFEHRDFDWTDYWSVMYWAIREVWVDKLGRSEEAFRRTAFERGIWDLKGTSVLRFTIERSGNISRIEMLTPSGIEALDLASHDALRDVILPPLPADFKEDRERVTGSFTIDYAGIR